MSRSAFKSTSFYLSVWTKKEDTDQNSGNPGAGDIDLRTICNGKNCSLDYNPRSKAYVTSGKCLRSNFCTELRIIKDEAYLRSGRSSNCLGSIDFNRDLKEWAN
jgi:hypothetical protein